MGWAIGRNVGKKKKATEQQTMQWFSPQFGVVSSLQSDNGLAFESKVTQKKTGAE